MRQIGRELNVIVMCWPGAFSAPPNECGSVSNSSKPAAAIIFGRTVSTNRWRTSSTCRTKSSRVSLRHLIRN